MIRRALWAGALAGLVVGAVDALSAWGAMARLAPAAGSRLGAAVFAATLYGAAGALVAAGGAAVLAAALRWTALARLVPHARATHAEAAAGPSGALAGVAVVLVGLPVAGAALFLAWRSGALALAEGPPVPRPFLASPVAAKAALGAGVLAYAAGLGAALVGAGVAALAAPTLAGRLWAHARAALGAAQARGSRDALVGLALLVASLPVFSAALAAAWRVTLTLAVLRRHKGLVAILGVLAVLVALAAALALTLFLAHTIERGLAALPDRARRALGTHPLFFAVAALLAGSAAGGYFAMPRGPVGADGVTVTIVGAVAALAAAVLVTLLVAGFIERALAAALSPAARARLSHPLAPAAVGAALGGLALAGGYLVLRGPLNLDQVALRPVVVALALPAAAAAAWPLTAGRLERAPRLVAAILPLVLLALALVTGASETARKAAFTATGLTSPLAQAIRAVADRDRDGYSALLGGGDCDDGDASVHPGAFDFPDDGVDQNCLGGDLRLARDPADLRFVAVPPTIPQDANIVLITIDTLRADHVGAYGYARPTTPALDALAAEGTLFVNGWAHAPSTRYSMPAILTGRYPSQVAWDFSVWWPALRPENTTLAELLAARGFMTGAILNYHYFDRVRRMDQGFAHYDNENARLHSGSDPASTSGTSAAPQSDKAIAFVREHAARRFFLWVHYYDPHYKYERHAGTPDFGDSPEDLYDHEIRYTDEQIARVVAELKAQGLYDRTVIVVTGDHGEGFGEKGIDFHGYHLYAPQTKVPMIIRVPGAPPRRVRLPASHVDLLPTLANLVGAAPSAEMLGRSLLGEIVGAPGADPDADRVVFQEVSYEGPTERRAAVSQRWHLIYNRVPDNTWELYDLAADPLEARDVSGDAAAAEAAAPVRAALLDWIDRSQFAPGAAEKLATAILRERPAPRTPLVAEFAGKVRLLGADLPAAPVAPGTSFEVTYYFQSLARLPGDYKIFVHLEGPTRFTDDHVPVDGALPFARWQPGMLVADRRTVLVPRNARPGSYGVVIGLWQPKPGNLPATGDGAHILGGGRVRVGTITVGAAP